MNFASMLLPCKSELPATSVSSSSSAGMKDFSAGAKKASSVPNAAASTKRCQRLTAFNSTSAVRIAQTRLRKTFDATINLCGDSQSLTAPPTRRKTIRGIVAAIMMVPTARYRSRHLQHQPRQRHQIKLVTKHGDCLADEQQSEIA